MPNDPVPPPPVEVRFTPEFKRNIRQLAKKYRRIKTDVQPLLDELGQGQAPGDQIPGVQYEVFKARVRNSDSGKGKSGGYRVIYQRTTEGAIVLITIYSRQSRKILRLPIYDKSSSITKLNNKRRTQLLEKRPRRKQPTMGQMTNDKRQMTNTQLPSAVTGLLFSTLFQSGGSTPSR